MEPTDLDNLPVYIQLKINKAKIAINESVPKDAAQVATEQFTKIFAELQTSTSENDKTLLKEVYVRKLTRQQLESLHNPPDLKSPILDPTDIRGIVDQVVENLHQASIESPSTLLEQQPYSEALPPAEVPLQQPYSEALPPAEVPLQQPYPEALPPAEVPQQQPYPDIAAATAPPLSESQAPTEPMQKMPSAEALDQQFRAGLPRLREANRAVFEQFTPKNIQQFKQVQKDQLKVAIEVIAAYRKESSHEMTDAEKGAIPYTKPYFYPELGELRFSPDVALLTDDSIEKLEQNSHGQLSNKATEEILKKNPGKRLLRTDKNNQLIVSTLETGFLLKKRVDTYVTYDTALEQIIIDKMVPPKT